MLADFDDLSRDATGYILNGRFKNVGRVETTDVRAQFPEMPAWRTGVIHVGNNWVVSAPFNHAEVGQKGLTLTQPATVEFSARGQVYKQETFVDVTSRYPASNFRGYQGRPLGKPVKVARYAL